MSAYQSLWLGEGIGLVVGVVVTLVWCRRVLTPRLAKRLASKIMKSQTHVGAAICHDCHLAVVAVGLNGTVTQFDDAFPRQCTECGGDLILSPIGAPTVISRKSA